MRMGNLQVKQEEQNGMDYPTQKVQGRLKKLRAVQVKKRVGSCTKTRA